MQLQQATVLCVAGFDPTGGAGLQADIETLTAIGVRATCAQTCNTLQNACGIEAVIPTSSTELLRQINSLLDDFSVGAVKIGAVASANNAEVIARGFVNIDCPLVVDPVLRDATGKVLGDENIGQATREYLLPLATCTTPNLAELMSLVPEAKTPDDAADALLHTGCSAVFVTSRETHEKLLCHTLYRPKTSAQNFFSPRLSGEFHGSGCTLSSALAAYLALENPLDQAINHALAFTTRALKNATTPERNGKRKFPNRSCHAPA